MALKDQFNKLIAYFDTDEISDIEETEATYSSERPAQPQVSQRRPEPSRTQPPRESGHLRPVADTSRSSIAKQREQMAQNISANEQTKIAIKYPKQYDDARKIVNLLIENETVLIDFQFMQDASARRCLDYLSGACSVLYGNLQKVSSSMYLLTPVNVMVDIEDLGLADGNHRSEGSNFDFDMKRR